MSRRLLEPGGSSYKFVVSVIFGLAGFGASFIPLSFALPPYTATLMVGLIFPMLISLAWGPKYALVSMYLGLGGQAMWFLWLPSNGWAPFVAIPLYHLWILWHGWCARRKPRLLSNIFVAEIPFRLVSTVVIYTLFRWVWRFNPSPWAPELTATTAPLDFVTFVAVKELVDALVVLMLAHILMDLTVIRRILGMEERRSAATGHIVSLFLLVGFGLWFLSAMSDHFYADAMLEHLTEHGDQSLAETLFLHVPPYELFTRSLFVLICGIAGLVVARYIGKFRQVEAEKEEAYRIVNRSRSVAFLWRNQGGWPVEYVSENVRELTGHPARDFISGRVSYASIIHPDDLERVAAEVERFGSIAGRTEFDHEPYRLISRDAEFRWVSDHTSIRRSEDGTITHYDGIVEDITWRVQAEQSLAEETERLAVTLRSIGDGVVATNTAGTIVLMSKVAEELTGWTLDQARGLPLADVLSLVDELSGAESSGPVATVIAEDRIVGLGNHTILVARDGTRRSIEDSAAPIHDTEGRIIGVVLVFRDVTEERRTREELLKIRKLESVGVLAGGIAHDFNNILTAVMGNIDLAVAEGGLGNQTKELLAEALKATLRARALTQQLLTFSRGGDPIRESAAVPEVIRESTEFVLRGTHIECRYEIPEDLWFVDMDRGQISQVIQNLVLNAKESMPDGGTIDIRCSNVPACESVRDPAQRVEGPGVLISISDRGCGIPADEMDRIFDPYYSTKPGGTGLGLAVCHSIVVKHDGRLSVESEPGEGTTFTICLPASGQRPAPAIRVEPHRPAIEGATIIVMDDEQTVRDVAASMLAQLGHTAVTVRDGGEAVQVFSRMRDAGESVDLIIMDLTIRGGRGGKDAVQEILSIDPEARVVVSSGYSTDSIMANWADFGFRAAVAKPYDLKELRAVIERVLG